MNFLRNNYNYNKIYLSKSFLIILFNLLHYVSCSSNQLNTTTATAKNLIESVTTEVIITTHVTEDEEMSGMYVATTPKIAVAKPLSRYEQGLEDYEEAVDRIEKEEDDKKSKVNEKNSPFMALMDVMGDAWLSYRKSSKTDEQKIDSGKDLSGGIGMNSTTLANEDDTSAPSSLASVGEGRASYIKGDPLNGYYDFIITEGSYKFWSAFQLATAALIIYSTFAAIYYSKVNPLTGDYDYVDYLSRSFHGRSLSDDDDTTSSSGGGSYFSSVFSGNWMGGASHAFQFVMDAIDRVPE